MVRRFSFRFFAAALLLTAGFAAAQNAPHRGRKYKAPPPVSHVEVTVLRANDQKPVDNAAVVFRLESETGNMELKTDEDGKSVIDVLPTGAKVLIQVIAKGYQTFGGEYTIDKPEMSYEIKLKRPGEQYSIYDNHPEAEQPGGSGSGDKPESH